MNEVIPTTICILGGAGDLARKKLIPALFDLYIENKLPTTFRVIGFARTERSNEDYREIVKEVLFPFVSKTDSSTLSAFIETFFYATTVSDSDDTYIHLKEAVENFETEIGAKTNRLFYLAIPPFEYETTLTNLYHSGLAALDDNTHFARILIEKPFGNTFSAAKSLDVTLQKFFKEEQIFRIDHYLAKEAVQNILSFRFANILLQSAWNNAYVKEVHITLKEKNNVATRGSFYDKVGALIDVGQNHLLQILALITMDEPKSLSAKDIRGKRAEILSKVKLFTDDTLQQNCIKAQYIGYQDTEGVASNSQTETYFEFKAGIDTEAWRGVPFYVRSGKALDEEKVLVEILFHDVATGPFETSSCFTVGNKVELSISPTEETTLTLNVKEPGRKYQVESKKLLYTHDTKAVTGNAYEKVLLDCIEGDQTVFASTDEVLASWEFIHSIMELWGTVVMQKYAQGSNGPEEKLFN